MKLLILGVGNPLMGDDGFGVAVVGEIMASPLPEGVVAMDGGTAGFGLISAIEEAERLLVIDAADMGKPPGTLVEFTPRQVRNLSAGAEFSLHQADLLGTLRVMEELGTCPPTKIIALQTAGARPGEPMSGMARAAVPRAADMVKAEIREAAGG